MVALDLDTVARTNGTMTVSGYDGSYIDATYDVKSHVFNNRWDGDTSSSDIEFSGTMHAGICGN